MKKNHKKRMGVDGFNDLMQSLSKSLLANKRTEAIVMPYMRHMMVDEAEAFLKCLSGLLVIDDDTERKKICKDYLKDEADFIMMMVRELDKIIAEEVKK